MKQLAYRTAAVTLQYYYYYYRRYPFWTVAVVVRLAVLRDAAEVHARTHARKFPARREYLPTGGAAGAPWHDNHNNNKILFIIAQVYIYTHVDQQLLRLLLVHGAYQCFIIIIVPRSILFIILKIIALDRYDAPRAYCLA